MSFPARPTGRSRRLILRRARTLPTGSDVVRVDVHPKVKEITYRPIHVYTACWRIQACIAIPAATPALIERVEPYWVIEQASLAAARASSVRPDPSCPNSSKERRGKTAVSSGIAPGRLSTATIV